MMNDERKNALYEKLEGIYDEFSGMLIVTGWNGEFFGYTETCRSEIDGSGFKVFSLDNGFKMMLIDPAEKEEEPSLTYWFDDNDVMEVTSWNELVSVLQMKD